MRYFFSFLIGLLFIFLAPFCYGHQSRRSLYSNYLKGVYLMQQGRPLLAQRHFEEVKRQNPSSVYIRHKIATALVQQEKIKEAERVLKEAKDVAPDNLDTYLALIFIYSYTGEDERLEREYEDFLEKAHQKKPDDVTITSYLAQFYFYQERLAEAIALYERILAADPESLESFFWLGYLYYESGQKEKAKDLWKEGLLVDSAYAPILNALGYTYAEEGIKLKEAKEMIEKALEADPYNGAYLDSLGWVYFKKGDLNRAKKYIKKALEYAEDPEIYYHLCVIYIDLGEKERGLAACQEGLDKFPDYSELRKILERYEEKSQENKD